MTTVNQANEVLVLPSRFVDAEWDKINPGLRAMLDSYLEHFKEYEEKGLAPTLFGSPGAGKTYAAAALATKLVTKFVPVYWAPTVQELNLILDLHDYKAKSYFSLKNRLLQTRVVVFDDFGQLRDFNRIRELFFEIVDFRYAWRKPTIFTASFNIQIERDWEEVTKCFNASLTRRIRSMSQNLVYNSLI